jgi:hypothetical protein
MSVMLYSYEEIAKASLGMQNDPTANEIVKISKVYKKSNAKNVPTFARKSTKDVIGRMMWYMYVANRTAYSLQYGENIDIFTDETDIETDKLEPYDIVEATSKLRGLLYNIYTNDGNYFLADDYVEVAELMRAYNKELEPNEYAKGGSTTDKLWIKTGKGKPKKFGTFKDLAKKKKTTIKTLGKKILAEKNTRQDFIKGTKPYSKERAKANYEWDRFKNSKQGIKKMKEREQAQMVKNMGVFAKGGTINKFGMLSFSDIDRAFGVDLFELSEDVQDEELDGLREDWENMEEEDRMSILEDLGYDDDEYAKGGYVRGQKFKDKYGTIVLQDSYGDGDWNVRRFSGSRIVGDVVMSESELDKKERIYAKGGSTKDWVQKVEDNPDFDEGGFSSEAKKRGISTQELFNKVMKNPDRYNKKLKEQAIFMENAYNYKIT